MYFSFSEDTDLWEARLAALKKLAESQVDVDLTSSASGRSRFLMAIHENGCPIMRIPARPVIRPALRSDEAKAPMREAAMEALSAAMDGDASGAMAAAGGCR